MTARITSVMGVMPREQSGARTGRKYEVQYEEAALACLKLLEETSAACVYCEWHDDFVVEHESTPHNLYSFHQVKTRSDARGAWSMFEVLGVKKPPAPKKAKAPKGKPAKTASPAKPPKPLKLVLREGESIAKRMLDHHRKFKDACAVFMFVTPSDVSVDPMLALVHATKSCESPSELDEEQQALFQALLNAHQVRDPAVTEQELWALVTRLQITLARASEPDPKVAIGLMGQMIHELSEVDVTITDQGRIADALLKVVRERSKIVLDVLPSEEEVRAQKAISLREVIKLLPLSLDGYERLRHGDKTAVKSLSRLQRLCQSSGMSERMIVVICDLKLEWQEWRARVGDSLTKDILGVLRESGLNLLRGLTRGTSSTRFQDLQTLAEAEATTLGAMTRMPSGLTANVVMGLVFALAAESQ